MLWLLLRHFPSFQRRSCASCSHPRPAWFSSQNVSHENKTISSLHFYIFYKEENFQKGKCFELLLSNSPPPSPNQPKMDIGCGARIKDETLKLWRTATHSQSTKDLSFSKLWNKFIRNISFKVYLVDDKLELKFSKWRCEGWAEPLCRNLSDAKPNVFLLCWLLISTFDITLAIKLLVCHLFRKCFAMFLIFTLLGTRKSLCEAHTSHLFSLFRELASASAVIRQTAPLIYCCWEKENIISNDGHFKMTKVILVLKNIKSSLKHH